MSKLSFVLLHGGHHSSPTWKYVKEILESKGHFVSTPDLPGAGPNAKEPKSLFKRPLDKEALATEISPNAGVTQAERTEVIIELVRQASKQSDTKPILLAHSSGGLSALHVAEKISDEISAVVFLTALMLPKNMTGMDFLASEFFAESKLGPAMMADPGVVKATRLDTKSDDPKYLAIVKQGFYADVSDEKFNEILKTLHSDDPGQLLDEPSPVTVEKFGTVPRHYIVCEQDKCVPVVAQKEMIRIVDESMGNKTIFHSINTSHSPFLSKPEELSEILLNVVD